MVGIRLKLHPDLDVFYTLETLARHDLLELGIELAVSLSWLDARLQLVPGSPPQKGRL